MTVGSLRRDDGGPARWQASLAEAFVGGAPVDWRLSATPPAELPTYAFTRRRFWPDSPGPAASATDLDRWRYQVTWRPAPEPGGRLAGTWLVLAPPGQPAAEWAASCASALSGRGAEVSVLTVDPDASRSQVATLLANAAGPAEDGPSNPNGVGPAEDGPSNPDRPGSPDGPSGIVSLLAAARQPRRDLPGLAAGTAATMTLLQALGDIQCPARLWLVTGQAVSTGNTGPEGAADPDQAQIWGLGRVAGLERPGQWGGLIDLPEAPGAPAQARAEARADAKAEDAKAAEKADARAWDRLAAVLANGTAGGAANGAADGVADGAEDQVAIRPSGVFVRRLARAPLARVLPPRSWRPRGTIMITGGTSPAGSQLARWLAASGAERLLLTTNEAVPAGRNKSVPAGSSEAVPAGSNGAGRNEAGSNEASSNEADSNEAGRAAVLAAELAALGADASITACDLTDRGDLARVLAAIPASQPLTAVFHAAGTPGEAELSALSLPEFAGMLREKTVGAANLDDLLAGYRLDAFVLFSSISAIWGSPGQAACATADAYLDALAERRRSRGLAATSIAWGPWSDPATGNQAQNQDQPQNQDQAQRERLDRAGLGGLATGLALAVLRKALDHEETNLVAAEIDWDRFLPLLTLARRWPFFDELSAQTREQTRKQTRKQTG
ncbi:MAG: KR domain-containing protein, partial [Nocardiopsaceae bacterium]|nr:KR domain-containing protein [Nocardiopsaceae bacterium]